jgi:hypothetical protein
LVKNSGRYYQEFLLEQRETKFPTPMAVALTVSIHVVVAVIDSFTVPGNSLQQTLGGGAQVEGQPNSIILTAEDSW